MGEKTVDGIGSYTTTVKEVDEDTVKIDIPEEIIEEADLDVGDEVDVSIVTYE